MLVTVISLTKGRNRCKRRRSGRRRTLRASVLHPTLPGRLRAPNPADNTTRSKCSNSEELRANAAQDCYLGLVGDPDSGKCRGRAPAGARPALLGARRPGVIACPGTPRVRSLSAPAPTGALPPFCEGDEKGSAPGALRGRRASTGPAERCLCRTTVDGSPDERSDIREQQRG